MIREYMKIVKALYPNAYCEELPYWPGLTEKGEFVIHDGEGAIRKEDVLAWGRCKTWAWRQAAFDINVTMLRKLES